MQSVIMGSIRSLPNRYLGLAVVCLCSLASASANSLNADSLNHSNFGDWLVQCAADPRFGDQQAHGSECILSQHINFVESDEPLLKIDLYLNPRSSRPEAIFVLPLGMPLNTAPALSFSHASSVRLAISHCHSDGCYFKMPLTGTLLEAFLSMQWGLLKLRGNDNETVEIPISGKGSRAAHNYFKALAKD